MADASISQLIVLVVSLSIAVTVGGMVMQSAGLISGSIEQKGSTVARQMETDIEIINDPEYMTENIGDENVLVLYVKNTGTTTLDNSTKTIDVFIDGEYVYGENLHMEVMDDGEEWSSSKVLKIETYTENYIINHFGAGDHKAKVVVYNNEDTLKFKLED